MEIYKKLFGERLRSARKKITPKMTQARLAEIVGVEPPSVSRWETGVDFPEDGRLSVICAALGVSAEYFGLSEGDDSAANPPRFDPSVEELMRIIHALSHAEPHRRLAALYLLTDDEFYGSQLRALPDGERHAAYLKKALLSS